MAGSPPKRLLDIREVAVVFGVDPKTVQRWARTGKLPCVRTPGGGVRFRAEDIDSYLKGQQ